MAAVDGRCSASRQLSLPLHNQPSLHNQPHPTPPYPALLAAVVRAAAERGAGHAGLGAAAFVAPLLLNLALSLGDNEEVCYCLKVGGWVRRAAWDRLLVMHAGECCIVQTLNGCAAWRSAS